MVDSFRESKSMALKVQREELHLFIESLRRKSISPASWRLCLEISRDRMDIE
jgi:hypothetical protein